MHTIQQPKKINSLLQKWATGEFSSSPVVRTPCSHCGRLGSIPGPGTKILQAAVGPKQRRKHGQRNLNRHFSKRDMIMAHKHLKKCLTSLINREMQIKTTMSDHLIRVRMSIIKTTTYSTEDNTRKEETGPVIDGTTDPEVPAFQSYSRPGKKSRAPHHQPKLTASNLHLTGRISPNIRRLQCKKTHLKKRNSPLFLYK